MILRTPPLASAVPKSVINVSAASPPPIRDTVRVLSPGVPTIVTPTLSPTILIFPAAGDIGPPLLPVSVCTKIVPPVPTVPSCPAEPINTGMPSAVSGVTPTIPEMNALLSSPIEDPEPDPICRTFDSPTTPEAPIRIFLLSLVV